MDHEQPASLLPFRLVFLAAAIWTSLGAGPGFFDPAGTLALIHGAAPDSALALALFRGASGQTLLFAVGYLLAAAAPRRHAAVVGLGGIGKALYAARLLGEVLTGGGGPLAVVAVVGDLLFVAAFVAFFATSGVLRTLLRPLDGRAGSPAAAPPSPQAQP
jgi:hypothetical protein